MISLLLLLVSAFACEPLADAPESFQVAWVSPISRSVRARAWLEVVRVTDLRAWIHERGTDPVRLLQGLGMVGRKPKARAHKPYKVTLFDVKRDWLCRPVSDKEPGTDVSGVAVCEAPQHKGLCRHKKGYTGCGYTLDTESSIRGLDVFRVRWEVASALGFCVMPLERFLSGA